MVDFAFFLDIFITFITPFEREDGTLEYNFKKIKQNYIDNHLRSDIIASFPPQAIYQIIKASVSKTMSRQ